MQFQCCKKAVFCKSKRGFSILVANRIDFVITNTAGRIAVNDDGTRTIFMDKLYIYIDDRFNF